jgi:hypothetical protein
MSPAISKPLAWGFLLQAQGLVFGPLQIYHVA